MEDPTGGPIQGGEPTMVTKISDKIRRHDSSSSDSEIDDNPSPAAATVHKSNPHRLFGREKPVHKVLGGGKYADVVLWRNKKMSATAFGGATVVWYLFEVHQYHLITLISHITLLALAVLFVWTRASAFINRSPPKIPEIKVSDKSVLHVISLVKTEMNHALDELRDIASGRNLRRFLGVMLGLWFLAVVGGWFDFLTLIYFIILLMFSVPVFYEKYEDQVDPKAQKVLIELHKHFAVLDQKVLSKIPSNLSKNKKH